LIVAIFSLQDGRWAGSWQGQGQIKIEGDEVGGKGTLQMSVVSNGTRSQQQQWQQKEEFSKGEELIGSTHGLDHSAN